MLFHLVSFSGDFRIININSIIKKLQITHTQKKIITKTTKTRKEEKEEHEEKEEIEQQQQTHHKIHKLE